MQTHGDLLTGDLWPALSLDAWHREPERAFEQWLGTKTIALSRGFRETSKSTYAAMFSVWIQFLKERHTLFLEAQPGHAAEFFGGKQEAGELEAISRRRYLQLLDRLYKELKLMGWTGDNPLRFELMKEKKLPDAIPVALTDPDLARLNAALATLTGAKGERDRALIAVLAGAGLRTNEAAALTWDALVPGYRLRIVPAGVHREHVTAILPEYRAQFAAWVAQHGPDPAQNKKADCPVVFPAAQNGKAFSPSGLFRRICTWLDLAGLTPEERGANILRNTFARIALTRYPVSDVQEWLGHEEERATLKHAPHLAVTNQQV